MPHHHAHQEKSLAAANSVAAALGLTLFKIVVGLLTNSLGIMAEAAHSGLDLMGAVMTFFAVRVADKPADAGHPFGHGKMENVSALLQTVLLLATAGWVIYEAISRLITPEAQVEMSIWAFIVMGTSIVVDVSRSRMLHKAAKKHNSQALEADARHFSIDIWSSAVVIFGLVLIYISREFPALAWLEKGDAVAALVVAGIIIAVSGELGLNAVHALLDAAPRNGEQAQIVQEASVISGVLDVHAVRIRSSGGGWFVDMHLTVAGDMSVAASHAITEQVEALVQNILPESDVTVHVEPQQA
jgi:cation diffusion facilitator family transporter